MKNFVLMLTNDLKIDRRILQEADSLRQDGWHVKILAMPCPQEEVSDSSNGVVRINRLRKDYVSYSFIALHFYRKIYRYFPIFNKIRPFLRKIFASYFINWEEFYISLFKGNIEEYSPSVVMAHDLPMLPVACWAAKKIGAQVVYDSHELYAEQEFSSAEKKDWKKIESKYIKNCTEIITVNNLIGLELQKRYSLASKPHIIHNAVISEGVFKKTNLFHKIFQLSECNKIVLFQGGVSDNRNLDVLIKAFTKIRNQDVCLVILGDGPEKKFLIKLTKNLNLVDKVFFHPAVPQKDLLNYTINADVGIIPYQATSLNNYLCTPNKLFEFVSTGVPIIASDLPAIRELVLRYEVGRTASLKTEDEIAYAIEEMFESDQTLEHFRNNINNVREKFLWNPQEIIKVFEPLKCI